MSTDIKPPISFWVIASLAILWNIIEIYFGSVEFSFLKENSTVEEFETIQSVPVLYSVAFIVALFSEMLGSFMLFMRKKIAATFYLIALITLVLMELYWLFFFNIKNTSVLISIVIPVLVILIAVFLYLYSKNAIRKGWLR